MNDWNRFENAMKGEHSGWEQMRLNKRLKTKEEKAMEQNRPELKVSSPMAIINEDDIDWEQKSREADRDMLIISLKLAKSGDYQLLKGCKKLGMI